MGVQKIRTVVPVVFAVVTLLAACGTGQAQRPSGDCLSNTPGPLSGGPTGCERATPTGGNQDDDGAGFDPEVGRIAMSADGNQHDNDDWASAPMALYLIAAHGLQANLVHYDYNDHIWDSDPTMRRNMTESVMEGGERFGFDTSKFFDDTDPDQLAAGQQNLVDAINASTEDDQLSLVLAGPMETAWQALNAADPEAREHVECVSHGDDTFNQTHAKTDHGGHDYDDLIDLGCEKVNIPDQNNTFGPTDMSDWDYLEDGDDDAQWLYSRLDLVGNGDVSDAGMVYYVLTGEEEGDRDDLRAYLDAR